ncbi:MAG TPA: xanthine dehydrogenase family protein molybdopterin-binding subunit [Acidobacteriaceae bacterium]|nr:xanthine dehydrogenase family protein molybdopterin-binding subunit [Acidobacteriaceae bacterium]
MAISAVVGSAVTRVDGKLKVTGAAQYAVDHPIEGVVFGVPVASTVGSGTIAGIDGSVAEKMPGVLGILHHGNSGPLYRTAGGFEPNSIVSEGRLPFSDNKVYYYGQYVALVVADTFERALDAAAHVKVNYETKKPLTRMSEVTKPLGPAHRKYERGDAEAAFQSAAVKVDGVYVTPTETHNPMEMHATIAVWNGDKVTLYETTQGVVNHQGVMAQVLGLPLENVHVISPFMGSGFGGKLFPWPQSMLAAMAARKLGRPVKVTVPRSLMFSAVGHRPLTEQHIRLGATKDGKLTSIIHEVKNPTSMVDDFMEGATGSTPTMYSCPNVKTAQWIVRLNIGSPMAMRGPGACPGMYGLDSALDDLAIKLNMDPLQIRLKNYAEKDESSGKPYSSKHLRECYEKGAAAIGWDKRTPGVGSMRDGNEILGLGVGTAIWGAYRGGAQARVRLSADGRARVASATQDLGTGTYTVMAVIVADKTGLPVERIDSVLGDSSLPPGPMSGGSTCTATIVPAVAAASVKAIGLVLDLASKTDGSPYKGVDAKTLAMTGGRVHKQGESPESGVAFEKLLQMGNLAALEAEAETGGNPDMRNYSMHTFGAHFVEVGWDPGIARLRVRKTVTVMDAGRIISEKSARNQILGAVVMGLGMGMFEEAYYDKRNAKPLNNNFADYMVPTNADIPEQEVIFLDIPDPVMGEYGARGIGEIGLVGVAPALTMAVYHATGVRVRKLPVRIEQLMGSKNS